MFTKNQMSNQFHLWYVSMEIQVEIIGLWTSSSIQTYDTPPEN